jgi:hypothetical protein
LATKDGGLGKVIIELVGHCVAGARCGHPAVKGKVEFGEPRHLMPEGTQGDN